MADKIANYKAITISALLVGAGIYSGLLGLLPAKENVIHELDFSLNFSHAFLSWNGSTFQLWDIGLQNWTYPNLTLWLDVTNCSLHANNAEQCAPLVENLTNIQLNKTDAEDYIWSGQSGFDSSSFVNCQFNCSALLANASSILFNEQIYRKSYAVPIFFIIRMIAWLIHLNHITVNEFILNLY